MRDPNTKSLGVLWPTTLLASTALASVQAMAQQASALQTSGINELSEITVTAEKREENIQQVPMSIQAVSEKQLEQLTVNSFQDYVKYIPSVSFQSNNALNGGAGGSLIYMRGIVDGNTSPGGPLPTVATYLDEQPVTDIGGTLDVHIYDVARIEVLPGPQGTLYGASSEAGTLRIITNQPSLAGFSGGVDVQGNTVSHGGQGYVYEGFVNIPLGDRAAIRLVGFDEDDAGFIDNVYATRTFATSGQTINNARYAANDFDGSHTYGGRAALKVELNDSWTVTPTVMAQEHRTTGINAYEPDVGYLKVERFGPDSMHDRWVQTGLTITGKISNLDVTYAGAYFNRHNDSQTDYSDYSVFYDSLYGSGASWTDNQGKVIGDPRQEVYSVAAFTKQSNELRVSTPASNRLRFIGGLFQENQTADIVEPYTLNDYSDAQSVPGFPHTIFLIDQNRVDRDLAAFGEATFDITSKLSILGGIRGYDYRNTLEGYYAYRTPSYGDPGSLCVTATPFQGAPCATFNKKATGNGETHKVNLTYKFDGDRLVYATYSTGFRPGGINRNPAFGAYGADYLTNYEIGWKTAWFDRRLIWNAALYYETWNDFQFTFEGPNGTSIYQNAPTANVKGAETNIEWQVVPDLTVFGGVTYNDSHISRDFCGVEPGSFAPIQDCTGHTVQVAKGTPLEYTPKFKGSVTARYSFSIPNLDDWRAHVEGSLLYRGAIPVFLTVSDIQNAGPYYRLGGYATEDLSMGVDKGGRSIELFAKNLLDRQGALNARTSCALSTCGSTAVSGVPQALYLTPTQPLTIGVKYSQRF